MALLPRLEIVCDSNMETIFRVLQLRRDGFKADNHETWESEFEAYLQTVFNEDAADLRLKFAILDTLSATERDDMFKQAKTYVLIVKTC